MMKTIAFFVFVCLLACTFAQDEAAPVSITKNVIGDVSRIDLDISGVVSTNLEANILSAVLAILNQQAAMLANPN